MSAIIWIVEFFIMLPVNFIKGLIWLSSCTWLILCEFIQILINMVLFIANALIALIGIVIDGLLLLFPPTPFNYMNLDSFEGVEFIGFLDWVIPLDYILHITLMWSGCLVIYFGIRVLSKWLKVV